MAKAPLNRALERHGARFASAAHSARIARTTSHAELARHDARRRVRVDQGGALRFPCTERNAARSSGVTVSVQIFAMASWRVTARRNRWGRPRKEVLFRRATPQALMDPNRAQGCGSASPDRLRRAVTRDEAIAKICTETKLTPDDLAAFLSCTEAERAALIDAYATAGIMPSKSAWDVVLAILAECAALANLVVPLEGAIQGAFAIVQTAKS